MAAPSTSSKGLSATLFERAGVPPIKDLIPCSLQHVLASFAGVITPALIIASMCGFTEEQKTAIIQVALILSAIDSLLQQFPLFGRIGSGLPILTGVSFAFLPAFQAVGIEFGFSSLLGAELVGGAIAIVFGMFYSKLKWLFPPAGHRYGNLHHRRQPVSHRHPLHGGRRGDARIRRHGQLDRGPHHVRGGFRSH